jgi:hypothetical protein
MKHATHPHDGHAAGVVRRVDLVPAGEPPTKRRGDNESGDCTDLRAVSLLTRAEQ